MSTIRPAKFRELEIIADFQVLMAKETENLDLNKEVILTGIEAVFEDPGKGQYYVAIENEDVIGCLLITPEWSEWRNGTVYWIQSVYIKEEHRGKGVFKELYQYIKELVSHEPDLVGIRLYVEKKNTNAQKVYKKLGMNNEHYELFEWLK